MSNPFGPTVTMGGQLSKANINELLGRCRKLQHESDCKKDYLKIDSKVFLVSRYPVVVSAVMDVIISPTLAAKYELLSQCLSILNHLKVDISFTDAFVSLDVAGQCRLVRVLSKKIVDINSLNELDTGTIVDVSRILSTLFQSIIYHHLNEQMVADFEYYLNN